jgi:hypothetical protein
LTISSAKLPAMPARASTNASRSATNNAGVFRNKFDCRG